MKISVIDGSYVVCKLSQMNGSELPKDVFSSLTITKDEISLVCEEKFKPDNVLEMQGEFSLLKVEGPLDFSLVGILAKLSAILAKEEISIFCISTYDTDYILVKKSELKRATHALRANGYDT